MHIDDMVALLVERLPPSQRNEWAVRQEGARAFWEQHGGEVLMDGEEEEEEEGGSGDDGDHEKRGVDDDDGAGESGSHRKKIVSFAPGTSTGSIGGSSSASKARVTRINEREFQFCEGCNERGHLIDDCPHQSEWKGRSSSSSEEEEDGSAEYSDSSSDNTF